MSEIVADEDVLDVIRAMMREGMQVSEHYGVRIRDDDRAADRSCAPARCGKDLNAAGP